MNYNAKLRHLFALAASLPADRLSVIDYDDAIAKPRAMLGQLARRAGFGYREDSVERVRSAKRKSRVRRLLARQCARVERLCDRGYRQARALCVHPV